MILRRLPALVMAALLALYLAFTVGYAIRLLGIDEPVAKGLGVAMLVLPLIAAYLLVAELLFGIRSERLLRRLDAEGGLPVYEARRRPSGRVVRDDADAAFPGFAAEVEAQPDAWRAWLRLSLAYDASGDRRRARSAARKAIALERGERRAATAG